MPDTQRSSHEHTTAPITPTNKGVVIGILVVLLIALGVFFFWRGTGVTDEQGRHPPKPAPTTDSAVKRG